MFESIPTVWMESRPTMLPANLPPAEGALNIWAVAVHAVNAQLSPPSNKNLCSCRRSISVSLPNHDSRDRIDGSQQSRLPPESTLAFLLERKLHLQPDRAADLIPVWQAVPA